MAVHAWQIVVVVVVVLALLATVAANVVYYTRWKPRRREQGRRRRQPFHGMYAPVRVATCSPVDLKHPIDKTQRVVDGVHLKPGDRLLVHHQPNVQENGLFELRKNGRLQRTEDLQTEKQIVIGSRVLVEEGETHGQHVFILQAVPSNGYPFQKISQGLVFVQFFHEVFGHDVPADHVLVTDPEQVTGVQWKDVRDVWPQPHPPIELAAEETLFHRLTLPSRTRSLGRHRVSVHTANWVRVFDVFVNLENGIYAHRVQHYGKSGDEVEILTLHNDQRWFRPQDQRACVVHVVNASSLPVTLHITVT